LLCDILFSFLQQKLSDIKSTFIFIVLAISRDFYARVVNPEGIHILTTPTETSVWKGRLEKDKVLPCAEVYKVQLFPSNEDGQSAPVNSAPIGVAVYFRLKDQRG
jgi:hypothetical protein